MLSSYLNQAAQYQELTGQDTRGEPTYADVVTLHCRIEHKTQEVITSDARAIKASHIYYLTHAVKEGDMLDGMRVQIVTDMPTLSGAVAGYKAVI